MNPTPKQQKLIELLTENLAKTGKRKTLQQMMREAGYSEYTSRIPSMTINNEAVQTGLKSFVESLDKKRRLALKHLTEDKLEKSQGRDLAYITDILTKNHQLLGGHPTERITISEEDKKMIDDTFKCNMINYEEEKTNKKR